MSEYTPTTEHVRAQYARQENYDDYYEGDLYLTPDGQISAQKFDRWLAQHDAEVAAKAKYELLMMQLENVRLEVEAERAQEATNE